MDAKCEAARMTEVGFQQQGRRTLVHFSSGKSYTRAMSEQALETAGQGSLETDLLDPYEKLVDIEVLGERVAVPENNRLLRCFQYLSLNTISYGDFCWNGECTNCQIWYHAEGQTAADDRPALSCRMEVREGMVITKLSSFIKLEGINK